MSRKKEEFVPQQEGRVTFYSCSPTAYEVSNLSLCRRFLVSDLITRSLETKVIVVIDTENGPVWQSEVTGREEGL